MAEKIEQYSGTGRRKCAVARVYLRPGKGRFIVNRQEFKSYFGDRPELETYIRQPLKDTQNLTKFDIIVNVQGGGPNGQAGAIRHGIARALLTFNEGTRPVLKKHGFLTRDSRIKERRKYGLHKARKASQFSKR